MLRCTVELNYVVILIAGIPRAKYVVVAIVGPSSVLWLYLEN